MRPALADTGLTPSDRSGRSRRAAGFRGAPLAALAAALALAACGDTLVDHRNTAIQDTGGGAVCDVNQVLCDGVCRSQVVTDPNYVCGTSCTPCSDPLPENAARTCTPVGDGGHDGVCGYECASGFLRAATGCSSPALVAAGGEFACATAADGGEVHCWGAGDQGQLGDGGTADRSTSSTVAGLSGVTGLAAGAAHACAVSGGQTRCWGARAGFGGAGVAVTPEVVAALAGAAPASLTAGGGHTCAIIADAVRCTGAALAGGGTPALTGTAIEVSAGDAFSCALMDSAGARSVWCWGDDTFGQLGGGVANPASATPVQIALPTGVQHVEAGARHACAATDATGNALTCWGDNSSTQILDVAGAILPPTNNSRVKKAIRAISAGGVSSCAVEIDAQDTLSCWSADPLAAGGANPAGEPNQIPFGTPAGAFSDGRAHACLVELGASPRLRCFGHGDRGQLGDGTAQDSQAPVLVVDR